MRLPQFVAVSSSSRLPPLSLALQFFQYARYEPFASYRNALGPLGPSRLFAFLDRHLDPLPMDGAKRCFASKAAALDELWKVDQTIPRRRILNLTITSVSSISRMLDHPVSDHAQVDIYETAYQMVAYLHGRSVIPSLPECAPPLLS